MLNGDLIGIRTTSMFGYIGAKKRLEQLWNNVVRRVTDRITWEKGENEVEY